MGIKNNYDIFFRIHDACVLLTLQSGSALLLHQNLTESSSSVMNKSTLNEIGVITLSYTKAIDILERRKDVVGYFK